MGNGQSSMSATSPSPKNTTAAASMSATAPSAKPASKIALQLDDSLPPYWEDACKFLMKKDRILRRIIPSHPEFRIESRGNAFATLARSIIGQQISTAAAKTVWRRFLALPNNAAPTPESIQTLALEGLRSAGLSARKCDYLLDLSLQFSHGNLHVEQWPQWEDEAIIKELVAVRGIGRWTAEMFLMFHLQRPNVLPLDDAGLLQGISDHYFSGEPVSRSDVKDLAQAWKPWRSVATWYIWHSQSAAK